MTFSKIGLHCTIGRRDGLTLFYKKIAGNAKLAIVKVVDDFGPALEAKLELGDAVFTVGRIDKDPASGIDMQGREPADWPTPEFAARSYYNIVRPIWRTHPEIDVWETFNEMSSHWSWQGAFFIEMMNLADPDGFMLAHYATSTGNPPGTVGEGKPLAAVAAEMLDCARETFKRGHYFSMHEYGGVGEFDEAHQNIPTLRGTEPWHALRHRLLYSNFPADARPKLLLSEVGQAGGYQFLGVQTLIDDMRWLDEELALDGYVEAAAIFNLGTWGDRPSNIYPALPALGDYIVEKAGEGEVMPSDPLVPLRVRRVLVHPQAFGRQEYFAVAGDFGHTVTTSPHDAIAGWSLPGLQIEIWSVTSPDWKDDIAGWIATNSQGVDLAVLDISPAELEKYFSINPVGQWPLESPGAHPPDPTPQKKVKVGLHMSADPGDLIQAEYSAIIQGRVECAKVLSATPPATIDGLVAAGVPVGNIVVRLFMAGDDPNLTDADKFWSIFKDVIGPLYDKGVRYFEFHNEPNWIGEWPKTAAEFADWFHQVSVKAHADYPEILVGFPGLSPRPNIGEWLDACDGVIADDADWIGVHCYWEKRDTPEDPQPGGMYHPESGGYWERFAARFPTKPLIITEYVNVSPAPYSMTEKAREALDWMAALPGDRIPMAFWYCSRASNVEYARMTWMGFTGQMNEIAGIFGGRAW